MIRANMAEPMWRQAPRALGWALNYLFTGTMFRIYRASPQYGLALTTFPDDAGVVARAVRRWADGWSAGWRCGWPARRSRLGVVAGIVAALGCFRLLRPLADRFFVVQINSHWPYLLEYARGGPSCWDRCIEAGAQRLVEIAQANAADEIVVVGHSRRRGHARRRSWCARSSSIRNSAGTARASCC